MRLNTLISIPSRFPHGQATYRSSKTRMSSIDGNSATRKTSRLLRPQVVLWALARRANGASMDDHFPKTIEAAVRRTRPMGMDRVGIGIEAIVAINHLMTTGRVPEMLVTTLVHEIEIMLVNQDLLRKAIRDAHRR
jgi:hypothetical protein